MKKLLYSIVVFFLFGNLTAQTIEKQWVFNTIESEQGTSLFEIDQSTDTFTLDNGIFEYSLAAKNNLKASGDYIFQNNLLVLFYNQPTDTIRRYRVTKLTEDSLSFSENNITYWFNAAQVLTDPIDAQETGDFCAYEVQEGQFRALLERHDRTWLNGCGEDVRRRSCAMILF